ncbi:LxmA leader domain family RiPP [Arthrobacter sp. M2012083]|uniref:LxmA leader domain family RiPP n=2 Tax=Micrococcaceae TaxID=1268 RepID=UPI00178C55CA
METKELMSLVSGYSTYAAADEISFTAEGDTPASSPLCGFLASFAFSYFTSTGGPPKR